MSAILSAVPLGKVTIKGFSSKYLERLYNTTLPSIHHYLEETGRIDNFRISSGKMNGSFRGFPFNDSDVYKWAEAVSYAQAQKDDFELSQQLNSIISELSDAQDENGYIDTFFPKSRESSRWSDLPWAHELYCAGHLIQAGIAHKQATNSESLFSIAMRFADHIEGVFGKGKREGAGGHPEIEMALIQLFRETRKKNYLDLARYFIDIRGKGYASVGHYPGPTYFVDHRPFLELDEMSGHAVRMLYLCCGVTDLFLETGEKCFWFTLERLWNNLTTKKMYITGASGSRTEWEAFGNDYDLSNQHAYAETCASIANFMCNYKMLLASGDARFADVMEQVFYNGLLAGISLDGKKYFYTNPLESSGEHLRKEWLDCACCPPNIARLIASFLGYIYTTSEEGLWVHLYEKSRVDISVCGRRISLDLDTDYPWTNGVKLLLESVESCDDSFSIFLRIPAWSKDFTLRVNGESSALEPRNGYIRIYRKWKTGDYVELELSMKTELVESHPFVEANRWKAAVKRGPMVFCAEHADNPAFDVRTLALTEDKLQTQYAEYEPLGKIVTVTGRGLFSSCPILLMG